MKFAETSVKIPPARTLAGRCGRAAAWNRGIEHLEQRRLLAADPILPDLPFWPVPREADASIDGVLSEASWDQAYTIVRTEPYRENSRVDVRLFYNDTALFIGLDVKDTQLWADGNGGGTGEQFSLENDDSFTFYFDIDNSRDEFFSDGDRAFGANIAGMTAPLSGSGAVRRFKFDKGTGNGGSAGVLPGGVLPENLFYATVINGTVNDNSDTDVGWTTEFCVPWAALGIAVPTHGTAMGINFDIIFDNTGGTRDLTDRRSSAERFTLPAFIDDHIQGSHSAYHASQAGIRGPVNYAEVMFIDSRAGARPATIADLAATNVTSRSTILTFTSPAGTQAGLGHVAGYEVRVSTSQINSDTAWLNATRFENIYVPRLRGLAEKLTVNRLSPTTTYFIAVRAVDGAGNLGDISNVATFTTIGDIPGQAQGRVIPSPNGSGLEFEDGTPFVAVGDHLGITWAYTRNLFTGDVWDATQQRFLNFFNEPSFEGAAEPYFQLLQARGINTMRVYTELGNLDQTGNTQLPRGSHWIENPPGNFNPDMRNFILNVLGMAATYNIRIIFSPFDTFSYDTSFNRDNPFSSVNGGPLTDINNFFQTPETLTIAKNRMTQVIQWANESPFRNYILAWEPMSEWDSFQWTLNPEGNNEAGRETEMRRRAIWIESLGAHIKGQDPQRMVAMSTIGQDPRGPVNRVVFYSPSFDFLTPHFYTNSNEEPINNPEQDRKRLTAVEHANITQYWMTHRRGTTPLINGEWGMTRRDWPNGRPTYDTGFSQAEDEANFRVMLWTGLATGQVGTALRIVTEELFDNAYLLTDDGYPVTTPVSLFNLPGTMRRMQQTFAAFVNSTSLAMDWTSFNARTLSGLVRATSSAGKSLMAWAVTDGGQGIAYVLQNGNLSSGIVNGAQLLLSGIRPDSIVDVEFWSTAPGATAPLSTLSGLFVGTGDLSVALPEFTEDVAVKFKAREPVGQSQRIVSVTSGTTLITVTVGIDGQPFARLMDNTTGQQSTIDLAAVSNFRQRVIDLHVLVTSDGGIIVGLTDERHHFWTIAGFTSTGAFTATDQTAAIGANGMTGDLTSYQPSWGAVHFAGLDARGHAVNYWFAPGLTQWQFSDLTELFSGPTMRRGLTGYVAPGDGLSLAGLDENNKVVLFYWGPLFRDVFGSDNWLFNNFTDQFSGPQLFGQLDAYVTDYGGLNIAGLDASGDVWTYWYAPALGNGAPWQTSNISDIAVGGTAFTQGVDVVVSTDFGTQFNIFGISGTDSLQVMRWSVEDQVWRQTNISAEAGNVPTSLPIGSTFAPGRVIALTPGNSSDRSLIVFDFLNSRGTWTAQSTGIGVLAEPD